jgi:hypothetical protein
MARAVQTAIDSLNFFVESRNAGTVISAVTTATGGAISADQFNTAQKGAMFFITGTSVTADTTNMTFSINAKDPVTGKYFSYLTAPVVITSTTNQAMILLYVGAVATTTFVNSNVQAVIDMPLPNVFQITTTLSVTNVSGSGTISYSVDYSKVM